jgi:hypothetical protein
MVIAMPFDLVAEVRCFLEREFEHAVDADAGEDGLLHHHLALGAREDAPADRGIFAFGVLAHHPEVDVARLAVGERRGHARHQPHRPQVDVLIELAAELNERAPQRNVVGDFRRPADRAEVDRVVRADALLPVLRHHALVLGVVIVGGEVEIVLAQLEAEFLRRRFEHPHPLGHDFLADAVAGNDGDAVDAIGGHGSILGAVEGADNEGKTSAFRAGRHCEERSDEAIQGRRLGAHRPGLLRSARNDKNKKPPRR